MHVRRCNVRLSRRGQEFDFGDARSSPRRYEGNNEVPFRSYSSRLASRYVLEPKFMTMNQKELSASVWVPVKSAENMLCPNCCHV
uniref:Uncharacterized protein n=1 Tax=Hyaloperonospora arabidopsidis (strain Emoy2) TaxID=559515 RepID=M4BLD2_HYAAE